MAAMRSIGLPWLAISVRALMEARASKAASASSSLRRVMEKWSIAAGRCGRRTGALGLEVGRMRLRSAIGLCRV